MKHLWLILFVISLSAQNIETINFKKGSYDSIILKSLDRKSVISQKQKIQIHGIKDGQIIEGKFDKIDQNNIYLIDIDSHKKHLISIDEIKEIKLSQGSKAYHNFNGFLRGGLACGGITAGFFGALSLRQGMVLDGIEIFIIIVAVPSAVVFGGTVNAIRYNYKYIDTYKIDEDNWKIVVN